MTTRSMGVRHVTWLGIGLVLVLAGCSGSGKDVPAGDATPDTGCDTADATVWYRDEDRDRYGDADQTLASCQPLSGYTYRAGDCDDTNHDVSPGEAEQTYNGIDDDCDPGTPDDDLDGDGHSSGRGGGDDCDDADASVYLGAPEDCTDMIINDCGGDMWGVMDACGTGTSLNVQDVSLQMSGGYQFGGVLAGAGDVDGDGHDDLLFGLPDWPSSNRTAVNPMYGAVYLVFGASIDPLSGRMDVWGYEGDWITMSGDWYDELGSVVAAGDVDGDGLGDVLATSLEGAQVSLYLSTGELSSGRKSLDESHVDLVITGTENSGNALTSAGDVDGDGRDEVVLGVEEHDEAGNNAGAAIVLLSGGALATPDDELSTEDADQTLYGEAAGDGAGNAVDDAGDVDGDGLGDVLVAASLEASGASAAGAVYLLLGGGALAVPSTELSLADADLKILGTNLRARAGTAVAGVGDANGDGLDDALVGAPGARRAGAASGAAYVLRGGSALSAAFGPRSLSDADLTLVAEDGGDEVGQAVAAAGDFDGDTLGDLLVGAPGRTAPDDVVHCPVYLVFGASLPGSGTLTLAKADLELVPPNCSASLPPPFAAAGDINADGVDDVIIGATNYQAAFLIFGQAR